MPRSDGGGRMVTCGLGHGREERVGIARGKRLATYGLTRWSSDQGSSFVGTNRTKGSVYIGKGLGKWLEEEQGRAS